MHTRTGAGNILQLKYVCNLALICFFSRKEMRFPVIMFLGNVIMMMNASVDLQENLENLELGDHLADRIKLPEENLVTNNSKF